MIKDYWVNDHLLITRYWGEVTSEELNQTALQKSGDERLDSIRYIVGDWLGVSSSHMTLEDMKMLVAFLAPISLICPTAKAATIVKPDKTGNALAFYYKMLCDAELSWDIGVFNTYEECFKWFDLPCITPPYMSETT